MEDRQSRFCNFGPKVEIKRSKFDLSEKVAVITGGAGLFGTAHAEAIAEFGGIPILVDIDEKNTQKKAKKIAETFSGQCFGYAADITNKSQLENLCHELVKKLGRVDILINNAANNPKQESESKKDWSRLENLELNYWNDDITVGLTGAFLCSQVFGTHMAKNRSGVILNIASDLGVIAPDQRIYRQTDLPDDQQPTKPVTYSVVKHGLIGLTKYLATYWADKGIRSNSISPGGIFNNQPDEFVNKLTNLIPQGRMANRDEYKSAVVFLVSDASSYMTGSNLIMDGGRTSW